MEVHERFDCLCGELALSDICKANAWALWKGLPESLLEGDPIPWLICMVYAAVCMERSDHEPAINDEQERFPTITAMMKAGNMRLVDFFHRMKVVLPSCDHGNLIHDHLEELKKKFCILAALNFKFKRTLTALSEDKDIFDSSEHREEFACLCWLLFVVCKAQRSVPFDLMTGFYLLLCCTDYLINNIPSRDAASHGPRDMTKVHTLQHICRKLDIPYSKVDQVYHQYWLPFLNSVEQDQRNRLLDVSSLYAMYEECTFAWSDIDERDFIKSEPHLFVSDDRLKGTDDGSCPMTLQPSSSKPGVDQDARYTHGVGMELNRVLDLSSESPSSTLSTFWNNCRKNNPTEGIFSRIRDVREQFLSCFSSTVGEQSSYRAQEIFTQGRKLYFRIMEAMLLAEERRLSCSDFSCVTMESPTNLLLLFELTPPCLVSALLNSDKFHLSLLGCSLEIALASQAILWPALNFPWILQVVKQKPYDFFKVIESYILHEPMLNSTLIKHLNRVEEQILESLAWKSESPLLADLERHFNPSDSGSSQPPSRRSQPLNLFIRKVSHLAHQRLTALCASLEIQDDTELTGHMWTCLEQSLKTKWTLLRDRHLDQMILCAAYAISKITDKEIQFKQIVSGYRSLSCASSHVYKDAMISDTEQDTIIGFYNRVYMPVMKPHILQFAPYNENPPASPRPALKAANLILRSPVKQVKNFYISPMKSSSTGMLTPKAKSLYSFGESPGSSDRDSLSKINASMKAVHKVQTSIPQKRLRFDDCEVLPSGYYSEQAGGDHTESSDGS